MKSILINGSKRESVGKKSTKALRNADQVPCVLYGGDQPVHFAAPELAFKNLVYTPNVYTVEIELEGKKHNAILQDIQFHPVTDRILHIDFYQIFDDKPVMMEIPVDFIGTPKGVKNGGVLRKNFRKLRVKGLPPKLPDFITAEITKLKIGNKLSVSDLASGDYTFMHPDNAVVCLVRTSRNIVETDDEDDEETEAGDVPASEQGEPQADVAAE
ncbi:50S ribosomal protein L25/general stress protein Ctc [Gangjinia marincola]|uniref:Large ribosomal subunit protein bL25 n=1 Tax=Gangjinia marincola TaxID=578463 RepID=A0ABN1MIY2_9FLAO